MLKTGDQIPAFELPDDEGNMRHIRDFLGQGPVILYFYPMDFTPGCTKEACSFRDNFEVFRQQQATVIGISSDSPESHRKFREKHRLPFPLLSDKGNKVRKQFGVKKVMGLIPARVTFIVDKQGKIVQVFDSLFAYEEHVRKAMDAAG